MELRVDKDEQRHELLEDKKMTPKKATPKAKKAKKKSAKKKIEMPDVVALVEETVEEATEEKEDEKEEGKGILGKIGNVVEGIADAAFEHIEDAILGHVKGKAQRVLGGRTRAK